ncbi:hypothetical protein SLE2022_141890 [Rubroshorea leprosula]
MTGHCSHCSHNGTTPRHAPTVGSSSSGCALIRKSISMGNLSQYAGSNSSVHNANGSSSPREGYDHANNYASEDFVLGSSSSWKRKKGL